jgi:L-amino acid N-acyltransferase YncA
MDAALNDASVRLRLAQQGDAARVCEIYGPFCRETAVSFEAVPPNENTMKERIRDVSERYPWLVAEGGDGSVLGYAYATRHRERAAYRWAVDFTVYLAHAAKRKGIGTLLYSALIGICKDLGYHRAFAGITLPNDASVGLHEKVGFRPVGVYRRVGFKLGKWHDVGWWALDLVSDGCEPGEPLPVTSIDCSQSINSFLKTN